MQEFFRKYIHAVETFERKTRRYKRRLFYYTLISKTLLRVFIRTEKRNRIFFTIAKATFRSRFELKTLIKKRTGNADFFVQLETNWRLPDFCRHSVRMQSWKLHLLKKTWHLFREFLETPDRLSQKLQFSSL